jgi:uncharacterized protein (TIGR03435 family)
MRAAIPLALTLLTAPAVFSQAPAARPEFEVASVKPSEPLVNGRVSVGVHIDGAMVRCTYLSLANYLTMAYDIKDYQIIGPDWLGSAHFDISAKRPEGVEGGEKSLRGMVASLLEDRFKLVFHRETRDLPAYALVVAKGGLKMKEVPPDPDGVDTSKVDVNVTSGARGATVDLGGGATIAYSLNKLDARKVNIPSIIDSLSKFLDRPVVDETGLTGRYNFTLEYSVSELKTMVRGNGGDASQIPDFGGDQASIFTSVEDLGLRFEPRKAPVPVIVIDSIQKTPTAN